MAVRVGILGATGAVGQRFIRLLDDHPAFELTALTASEESAGKRYDKVVRRCVSMPIPDGVAAMRVGGIDSAAALNDIDLLLSSLLSSVVAEVKSMFLEAGYIVSSNSSNDRMAPDMPFTIPEIDPEHLNLVEVQHGKRGWNGALVKNPNCSTITMVPMLAALDQFGLERTDVTTLQAVSGASYDGVTSMEIIDNVIPHIGGEGRKMGTKFRKLLGSSDGAEITLRGAEVNASCNRIPALDGHLESISADLVDDASLEDVVAATREYPGVDLPSALKQLIHAFEDEFRSRPHLGRDRGGGMRVSASGTQSTDHGVEYSCLMHNTVHGVAGVSVLNDELLAQEGRIQALLVRRRRLRASVRRRHRRRSHSNQTTFSPDANRVCRMSCRGLETGLSAGPFAAALDGVVWATGQPFVFLSLGPTVLALAFRQRGTRPRSTRIVGGHAAGAVAVFAACALIASGVTISPSLSIASAGMLRFVTSGAISVAATS